MSDSQKANLSDLLKHPLLGENGQLSRLINMRVKRSAECQCKRCLDFLSRLHYGEGLLAHAHVIEQWGLKHWLSSLDSYEELHDPKICAFADYAMDEVLHHRQKCVDLLLEAEHEWKSSEGPECKAADGDDVWLNHFRELTLACDAVRKQTESKPADDVSENVKQTPALTESKESK